MTQSILDTVMNVQRASAMSSFDPESIAARLFSILQEREQDILRRRHGLAGEQKITLEEIGKQYSVTRERIRQVENASLQKIRNAFNDNLLNDTFYLIQSALEEHGDIMTEDRLSNILLGASYESESHQALIRFILNQLLSEKLLHAKETDDIYKSWALLTTSWDNFNAIIQHLVTLFEDHGEPSNIETILDKARPHYEKHLVDKQNREQIVMNYIDITKKIEENKFNEWGLSHWNTIRPRRMNDKILLIMKKEGKPLHFGDIAKKINEARFDARIAYPATIHNELILDKNYVLVGRGIYALREWGYKPGVVLDVIKDILRSTGRPMMRDEIIEEVLKSRLVKRSTVVLALMNKKHFVKQDNGTYSLNDE